jgi:soluble lytic murein transglycosylase-like protein
MTVQPATCKRFAATPARPLTLALAILLALPTLVQASVPYASCFARSAETHEVGKGLLIAVSATESNWNANARSHANAHGMMQIQWPGTARHLGVRRVSDLYKPCTNIDLGAKYLRELIDRYHGDEAQALAAYNYGPGRIDKAKELPAGAKRYIATVRRHQQRLAAKGVIAAAPGSKATGTVTGNRSSRAILKTRTRAGAGRYIRALNKQVKGAAFSYGRRDGRHAVLMAIGPSGLSSADHVVLKSIGWRQEATNAKP